jgi:GNAT superfamily N-acetyltransferase
MLGNITVLKVEWDNPPKTDSRFSKQYKELFASIVYDAKKHNFHFYNLVWYGIMAHADILQYSIYHDKGWGWALVKDGEDFVEPDYVFVYPNQRRKGWFSALVTRLEEQQKEITVCTREEPMIKALNKLGFQNDPKNPTARDGSLMFNKKILKREKKKKKRKKKKRNKIIYRTNNDI